MKVLLGAASSERIAYCSMTEGISAFQAAGWAQEFSCTRRVIEKPMTGGLDLEHIGVGLSLMRRHLETPVAR